MAILPANRPQQDAPRAVRPGAEARVLSALAMTGVAVFGITALEVGATLLLRYAAAGTTRPVAAYFTLCSVMMIGTQFWIYPRLEAKLGEPRMMSAAFAALGLALGMAAAPAAQVILVPAFALAAMGIGILIPALAVRISSVAGPRQGWAMGRQAAAANLGQALGSAVTGSLFALAAPLPFLAASALLAGAAAVALRAVDVSRTPPH
jgi:predicted MFS family arabinose efflux permease